MLATRCERRGGDANAKLGRVDAKTYSRSRHNAVVAAPLPKTHTRGHTTPTRHQELGTWNLESTTSSGSMFLRKSQVKIASRQSSHLFFKIDTPTYKPQTGDRGRGCTAKRTAHHPNMGDWDDPRAIYLADYFLKTVDGPQDTLTIHPNTSTTPLHVVVTHLVSTAVATSTSNNFGWLRRVDKHRCNCPPPTHVHLLPPRAPRSRSFANTFGCGSPTALCVALCCDTPTQSAHKQSTSCYKFESFFCTAGEPLTPTSTTAHRPSQSRTSGRSSRPTRNAGEPLLRATLSPLPCRATPL
jgi:hypothetical protein